MSIELYSQDSVFNAGLTAVRAITQLIDPIADTDVATKSYVDLQALLVKTDPTMRWSTTPLTAVPIATDTRLGGVKIGDTLDVTPSGVLNYDLPTATRQRLGGVKIGDTLTINNSIVNYNLPTATRQELGGVKIGNTLTISNEVLNYNLSTATQQELGGIKIGNTLTISNGVVNVSAEYIKSIAPVQTVNGQIGDVIVNIPVLSVNNKVGNVLLTYVDLNAAPVIHTHDYNTLLNTPPLSTIDTVNSYLTTLTSISAQFEGALSDIPNLVGLRNLVFQATSSNLFNLSSIETLGTNVIYGVSATLLQSASSLLQSASSNLIILPSNPYNGSELMYNSETRTWQASSTSNYYIHLPENPTANQLLYFNRYTQTWEAGSPLNDLIPKPPLPNDGDMLVYSASNETWESRFVPTRSGAGIAIFDTPGTFSFTVPSNINKITVELYGGGGSACVLNNTTYLGNNGESTSCSIGGKTVVATGGDGVLSYSYPNITGCKGGSVQAVPADPSVGFSGVGLGVGGAPSITQSDSLTDGIPSKDGSGSNGGYGGGSGGRGAAREYTGGLFSQSPYQTCAVAGGCGLGAGEVKSMSSQNTVYRTIISNTVYGGAGAGGVGGGTGGSKGYGAGASGRVINNIVACGGGGGAHAVYCIDVIPGTQYNNCIIVGAGGATPTGYTDPHAAGRSGAVIIRY